MKDRLKSIAVATLIFSGVIILALAMALRPPYKQPSNQGGVEFGAKLNAEPAFNIGTGKLEVGPSLNPGPRIYFE